MMTDTVNSKSQGYLWRLTNGRMNLSMVQSKKDWSSIIFAEIEHVFARTT